MQPIKHKKELCKITFIIGVMTLIILLLIRILYLRFVTVRVYINSLIRIINEALEQIEHNLSKIIQFAKDTYLELNKIFNNRELAIGFWIAVFITYALSIKSVRRQLPNMIKILFCKKFLIWYFCMVVYFLMMILILLKIGFWDRSLLKNTIIWFITVGIISSGKAIGKAKDFKYFIEIIKSNIKLLIVVQFISNLYCFSFIKEIILIPVVVFLSVLTAIVDVNPQFKDKNSQILKNILSVILAIIGFYILVHSVSLLITNIHTVEVRDLIKNMLLPTILSIMFVSFIYLFVIYAAYEQLFVRLNFKKTINDKIRKYLALRIIIFCNFNILRINNFIFRSQIMSSYVTSKGDVKKLLANYKIYPKQTTSSNAWQNTQV